MKDKICKAITASGKPCQVKTMNGAAYCYFHHPDYETQRAEARKKGGLARNKQARTLPEGTPPLSVDSCEAVVELLALTINDVRTGRLDVKIANSIGFLAGQQLRASEARDREWGFRYDDVVARPDTELSQAKLEKMDPIMKQRILDILQKTYERPPFPEEEK